MNTDNRPLEEKVAEAEALEREMYDTIVHAVNYDDAARECTIIAIDHAREKDKEIASLRAELEGLKEQIPELLKEQKMMCADEILDENDPIRNEVASACKSIVLSAPSPQIKP